MNDDPRIDPADLRNVRFPGSSRRYDARSVDQFLESVAARISATNTLVDELRRELADARQATSAAPPVETPDLSSLDDDGLVRLVGDETATVLSTARRAAEEIRSKAEASAARVIREATANADQVADDAKARAAELTGAAEQALDQATAAAEAEATRIRDEAAEDAERRITEAHELVEAEVAALEERRAEADAEVDEILAEAREEGRSMVAEAKEVRVRILEDLQRRRDLARDQIERLLAGRERLLAAYGLVRENLDEITGQLGDALPHPDEGPEPELPDGFVGIVGAEAAEDDGAEVEVEDHGETVDDTVAPSGEVVDDTVAVPAEAEPADVAAADDPTESGPESASDGPDVAGDSGEPDGVEEPDGETVDDEVVDEEPAEEEVVEEEPRDEPDAADAAETAEPADVDALFARLRAEREQSVARAQEVLDSDEEQAVEPEVEPVEATAEEEPAEVAATPEPDTEGAETEPAPDDRGDVDRVPAEFLATEVDLERRAEALGPLEAKLNRALKRRLADEQNELLDLLRRSGSTVADELLPPVDDQIEAYARLAEKHLVAAASAGAAVVDGAVDVSSLALSLGAALAEPFRRRFERSADEVDGDPDELDERLRALYREWKVQHIGPVADDALLSAYARGTLAGAEPDRRVSWRIDPEQGPCPDAQDNALAGGVAAGEAFPTGDTCPQAHPGCRCLLVVE